MAENNQFDVGMDEFEIVARSLLTTTSIIGPELRVHENSLLSKLALLNAHG
jgi:hypothetical protein